MVDPPGSPVVVRTSAARRAAPWRTSRPILPPTIGGWHGVALGEWSLEGGWLRDGHPHDEITYVLAGELHVTVGAVTEVLGPGDTILVPGGRTARYEAPVAARMLFVYGPNPTGAPTTEFAEGPCPGRGTH